MGQGYASSGLHTGAIEGYRESETFSVQRNSACHESFGGELKGSGRRRTVGVQFWLVSGRLVEAFKLFI